MIRKLFRTLEAWFFCPKQTENPLQEVSNTTSGAYPERG